MRVSRCAAQLFAELLLRLLPLMIPLVVYGDVCGAVRVYIYRLF